MAKVLASSQTLHTVYATARNFEDYAMVVVPFKCGTVTSDRTFQYISTREALLFHNNTLRAWRNPSDPVYMLSLI